jgi:hypothetical protein
MLQDKTASDHARPQGVRTARRASRGLPAGLVAAAAVGGSLIGLVLWLHLLAGPIRLATGLSDASDHLDRANARLSNGGTEAARFEVLAGSAGAARARDALDGRSPLLDALSTLPVAGPVIDEADHLVAAAEHSATAARGTFAIADQALEGPNSILKKGGDIRIERVTAIGREVGGLRSEIRAAQQELRAVETSELPRRVQRSIDKALRKAREADDALLDANAAFAVLPGILGEEEKRTYLIGFQNSAEARGTGGAILQFALLTIEDGDVKLDRDQTGTIYEIDKERQQLLIDLPPDAWYQATIPDTRRFGNANWSPDFPLATKLLLAYAEESDPDFPRIDGVIGVAPQAMEEIMPSIGKLKVGGRTIGDREIVKFVLNEQYARYPYADKRRRKLRVLVDRFYEKLFDPKKPFGLLAGMSDALAGKHMQIWMRDRDEQAFIERMNWDGGIERKEKGDYLYIVEQNVGGNKLDYFDAQEDSVAIRLDGKDSVTTTRVSITNRVTLPQPRWVMGDSGAKVPPIHRPMVVLYTHRDSQMETAEVEGTRVDTPPPAIWPGGVLPPSYEEAGKTAWPVTMEALAGETATATFHYRSPGVVRSRGGRRVYRLVVQHQPKVRPEWMTIGLRLPGTAQDIEATGWKRGDDGLTWEGYVKRDMILEVSWQE